MQVSQNDRETLTLDYVPSLKLSNYEANQSELIEEVLALLNDNLQREKERMSLWPTS